MNKNTVKKNLAEARKRIAERPNREHMQVDIAMLFPLAEMAVIGIEPDDTFSENECLAWEVIRNAIMMIGDGE